MAKKEGESLDNRKLTNAELKWRRRYGMCDKGAGL